MIKTKSWVMIVGSFLLFFTAVSLIVYTRHAPGTVANIYRNGEPVLSIDLSLVTEPYELTLSDENGSNVIRVEAGRIAVVRADCPDKVCVKAGWRSDSASPIVCLPHRLVIRVERDAALRSDLIPDTVSQ